MTPEPGAVALHESAHLVALAHFGWKILDVRLDARGGGLVRHEVRPDPLSDEELAEDTIVAYAGYEAERWHARGRDPDWRPSITDHAMARRRLEANGLDAIARQTKLKRAEQMARHLVGLHWGLIQSLARCLERDRYLSGSAVLHIIREHGGGPR